MPELSKVMYTDHSCGMPGWTSRPLMETAQAALGERTSQRVLVGRTSGMVFAQNLARNPHSITANDVFNQSGRIDANCAGSGSRLHCLENPS